jgi:hypothetical protein
MKYLPRCFLILIHSSFLSVYISQTITSQIVSNSNIFAKPDLSVTSTVIENKPEPLILFSLNGLYGYVDKQMRVIVPPIYDRATHFSEEGYAVVRYKAADGFWLSMILDYAGNVVYQKNTARMGHLYDDIIYYARNDNLFNIIRFESNTLLADSIGSVDNYSEDGIILVRFFENSEWAFINSFGERILPELKMRRISRSFREQRATITDENGDMLIIDLEGKVLGNNVFRRLGAYFSENLLPAQTKDGLTGYVNKDGSFAFNIPFISENDDYDLSLLLATEFHEGYALIQTNRLPSLWRIINSQGHYVSDELSILYAYSFVDGLSCVKTNGGMYGYINRKGEMVINPVFEEADSFQNGFARIIYQGRNGLLNTKGYIYWSDEISEPGENKNH